ncbi:MAG: sirohydrochlorin cobaltochelatase [Thermodesulfobacteriota bacterium]
MKTGILLAAFGSSRETAHLSLRGFEERVNARFPDAPTRWAFSSGRIRNKLADQGMKTDSVGKALEKMHFEKYTHVAVQSLHVIPGDEFHDLAADAARFAPDGPGPQRFAKIAVGGPLMADAADLARAADAAAGLALADRVPGSGIVFMGHGTRHPGDLAYDDLARELARRDPLYLVATLDGALTIQAARDALLAAGATSCRLIPLVALAGRHVQRDMCGPHPESWQSILSAAGIEVTCTLTGTADSPAFAAIWLDHLEAALRELIA